MKYFMFQIFDLMGRNTGLCWIDVVNLIVSNCILCSPSYTKGFIFFDNTGIAKTTNMENRIEIYQTS